MMIVYESFGNYKEVIFLIFYARFLFSFRIFADFAFGTFSQLIGY